MHQFLFITLGQYALEFWDRCKKVVIEQTDTWVKRKFLVKNNKEML